MLTAVALAGCAGTQAGRASAGACTAIAARAARGQAALTAVPEPCRGLGPAQLNQTVKIAVSDVAGHGTKSRRRHLAIQAYRRLAVLTAVADHETAAAAAQRAAQARRRAAHPPAPPAPAAAPLRIPAGVGALVAWLLAAASGGMLVLRRLARRLRRPLPPVLLAHLGFALAGLAVWVAYLLSGWVTLAWASLAALLPVAGLGMATLVLAIPDPKPDSDAAPGAAQRGGTASRGHGIGRPAGGTAGATRTGDATSTGTPTTRTATATAARTRTATATAASTARPRPARPPVLLIAAHGALATITILLALLGVVAAVTPH